MSVVALNWETAHLYGEAWISHHRLRHHIFVARQQWDVPTFGGLEYDQFDTPAATYLLWLDDDGQARGVARLIPTTRPYMIQQLWPDLLDHPPPRHPTVWEATRFGCDHALPAAQRRRVIAELICACQEFAVAHGIRSYLGVMPLAIFQRVIAQHGCPVSLGAQCRTMGKHRIAAAYISASVSVLKAVRRYAGLTQPVLMSQPDQTVVPTVMPLAESLVSADPQPALRPHRWPGPPGQSAA